MKYFISIMQDVPYDSVGDIIRQLECIVQNNDILYFDIRNIISVLIAMRIKSVDIKPAMIINDEKWFSILDILDDYFRLEYSSNIDLTVRSMHKLVIMYCDNRIITTSVVTDI